LPRINQRLKPVERRRSPMYDRGQHVAMLLSDTNSVSKESGRGLHPEKWRGGA